MMKDPTFLSSLAALLISAAALYFGIPLSDPGLVQIGNLVAQGALAVSGIVAAVRALALRRKNGDTTPTSQ